MTTATLSPQKITYRPAHPVYGIDAVAITRVDMIVKQGGVIVLQYEDGWTAGADATDIHTNTTTSLTQMLEWFVAKGWTVVDWGWGARAWLGPKLPVRDRWRIKQLRRELATAVLVYPSEHGGKLHPLAGKLELLDLAFYL